MCNVPLLSLRLQPNTANTALDLKCNVQHRRITVDPEIGTTEIVVKST